MQYGIDLSTVLLSGWIVLHEGAHTEATESSGGMEVTTIVAAVAAVIIVATLAWYVYSTK